MLNVVTVNWRNYQGMGVKYTDILFDSVRRNLPEGFPGRFIVFTDDTSEEYAPGIEVRELPVNHLHGWFNKLALFKDGLFPDGDRVVFFDLDTVITGKLDDLAAYDGPLALLRDYYRPFGRQSSVMAWEAGKHGAIWSLYVDESYPLVMGGDQSWIEGFEPAILQDIFPGMFASYKADHCQSGPRKGASVIVFHGHPRPHECGGWVKHVWTVGGGTSAMLESVCNTEPSRILENVKSALSRGFRELRYLPAGKNDVVIVGGGPSLAEGIDRIPYAREVIGLNAAASWLIDNGVPCWQMILDARPEMFGMLDLRASAHIIASQCDPRVLEPLSKTTTTIYHSNTPGVAELLPKDTPLIGGGSTVGLQAMVLAYVLGFRKIHLAGMDSSYRGNEGHAYPQPLNDADERIEVIVAGQKFIAAPWMAQQAQEFQEVAASLANQGCEIIVHGDGLLPAVAKELARKHSLAEQGIIEPDGSPACQRATEIAKRMPRSRTIYGAEIGVFRGHMSRRLLAYMPSLNLFMVDSWEAHDQTGDYAMSGDFHAGLSAEQQEGFAQEAAGNVAFAESRRMIFREPSDKAAHRIGDGKLDFVFIDADHSYQGCLSDIEAWLPKLKPDGLLCGHDYDNPEYDFGVKRAVDEFIARTGMTLELGANYTWFARLNSAVKLAA